MTRGRMKIFGDLRSGLSPAVEELLEGFDSSSATALSKREAVVEAVGGAALLAVVLASSLLIGDQRPLDIPLAVVLILSYAAVSRIRFAVGYGFTAPTQIVFVPMLFLLPISLVPLCVVLADMLGRLPDYVGRRSHPTRLAVPVGDAWHAVG